MTLPGITWVSSYDQSRDFPEPIQCVPLERPLTAGGRAWATWYKIMRLIEGFPP